MALCLSSAARPGPAPQRRSPDEAADQHVRWLGSKGCTCPHVRTSAWKLRASTACSRADLRRSNIGTRWAVEWFPCVPRGSPYSLARFWHEHSVPNYRRSAMVRRRGSDASVVSHGRGSFEPWTMCETASSVCGGSAGQVGRLMGYVLAAGPACGALSAWLGVLSHLRTQSVGSAGIATAVALGFGLFAWWGLLRIRLELTKYMIVMVNPWGTQRLPWSSVSAVSLSNWGAQFHTTDGFTYSAYALSGLTGGTRQEDRFADVRRIADAQLHSGQPL